MLAFVLTVATILRLYGLDFQSLWNDELASWRMSNQGDLSTVIFSEAVHDLHPPGYHAFLHYWIRFFGDSEKMLRIPSALAGVAAVAVLFFLGVHLYSPKEGLLASSIMAVLWCPIFYSQMARVYSLLVLVILINVFLWVLLVEDILDGHKPDILKKIVLYIVASAIAEYLHYYTLIIIFGQAMMLAAITLTRRSGLGWFLTTYMLIFVAFLPWVIVSHMNSEMSWAGKPIPMYFIYYLQFLFNKSLPILLIATGIVLTSASYWLVYYIHRGVPLQLLRTNVVKDMGLILWLMGPFIVAFFLSLVAGKSLVRFYGFVYCVPAACLLLARGIFSLPVRQPTQIAVAAVLVLVLLLHLVWPMRFYSQAHVEDYWNHPHWAQFREASYFTAGHKLFRAEAVLLVCPNRDFFQYYLSRMGSIKRIDLQGCDGNTLVELRTVISRKKPTHLFFLWADRVPDPKLVQYLNTRFNLVDSAEFNSAGVMVYSLTNPRHHEDRSSQPRDTENDFSS